MTHGEETAVDVDAKFESPMSMKAAIVKLSHVFSDENFASSLGYANSGPYKLF